MHCPSCAEVNSPERLYCERCGAGLGQTCGACGGRSEPGAGLCGKCGASLTGTSVPASFVAGRYQVRRLLGEGSKKRVYLAHDTRLERDVALAVIRTEGLDDAGRTRIRREAQAMARLGDHPHVVTVHDIGEEGDQPYIVSQLMAGGDVAPEQALGRPADARSDLYAVGAMLYEMLAGQPLFAGDDTLAVISQHVNRPPTPLSWLNPDVPPAIEALVLQLLAKAPEERPAHAAEIGRASCRKEG